MAGEINPLVPAPGASDEAKITDTSPAVRPAPAAVHARSRLAAFTVADGLMLLIGGLAAWLRFGDLARLPLSAAEATAALANWQFWSAAPLAMPVGSPAYFAFTHLVMSLGADGDAAARLVPAVFGLLTVLLVWRWRKGPVGWLVAGLFLAVSPLLVAVSRTAGGDAIALFALMLLVRSWRLDGGPQTTDRGPRTTDHGQQTTVDRPQTTDNRPQSTDHRPLASSHSSVVRGPSSVVLTGIALGLGLTSSPLFYTGLVGLVIAAIGVRAFRPVLQGSLEPEATPGGDDRGRAGILSYVAVAAGVTFLVVATSLLLYPAGVGAALRLFPAWLGRFGLPGSAAVSPLLALLRYEPAAVFLGSAAVVWALRSARRPGRALAIWFGVTLVVVLLQPGIMVNAAVAVLPANLLVGLLAAAVAERRDDAPVAGRRTGWYTAVAIVGLGALVLAAGGRFARLNLLAGENSTLIALAVLAFVLAGLAVVLAMAWESPAARRGAFAGLAALLIFWQWGAAWQLSRQGANDPRERWVVTGTDDDVTVMVGLLEDISRQLANSDRDLAIFSQVESPVLRWYLRGYTGFASGPALPVNSQADVIITPDGVDPALPNDYFGADFGLSQTEVPNAGRPTLSDTLKWWLFRESTAPLDTQRVVLWVRSDLARSE